MSKNHISYSENLFRNKDGTPITFHVLQCVDYEHIVGLIEAGGGEVIGGGSTVKPEVVVSSNTPNTQSNQKVISSSYIYTCCFRDELVDMEEFRLFPNCCGSKISTSRTSNDELKCSESASHSIKRFSKEKMYHLIRYIAKCEHLWKEVHRSKVLGDGSWKSIQDNFTFWALKNLYENGTHNFASLSTNDLLKHGEQKMKKSAETDPEQLSCIDLKAKHSSSIQNERDDYEQLNVELEKNSMRINEKEAFECALLKVDSVMKESGCQSEEEEDIPPFVKKRKVIGCSSVVVEESTSESDESQGSLKHKDEDAHSDVNVDSVGEERLCESTKKEPDGVIKIKKRSDSEKGDGSKVTMRSAYSEKHSKKAQAGEKTHGDYMVPCSVQLSSCDSMLTSKQKRARITSTPISKQSKGSLGIQNSINVTSDTTDTTDEDSATELEEELQPLKSVTSSKNQDDLSSSTTDEDIANEPEEIYKPKISYRLRLYSYKEDMELLRWLCRKRRKKADPLTGNRVWMFMESRKVLPGRSWQSMRERFRRHIMPNLKKYPISEEDIAKLMQFE